VKSRSSLPLKVDSWLAKQRERTHIPNCVATLAVVIPAFDESKRLPGTLIETIDYLDQNYPAYELIVVDDGSADDTADIVRSFVAVCPYLQLISYPQNRGKGYAVKTGVLAATAPQILFMDADGSAPVSEVTRLQEHLRGGADLAVGSRALSAPDVKIKVRWYRMLIGRIFAALVKLLTVHGIQDTQCGFKLFTRDAARFLFERQRSEHFSFDVEILYIAQRAEMLIREVPVTWHHVPGSKVNLVLDSLAMARDLFRFRFWHRAVGQGSFVRGS